MGWTGRSDLLQGKWAGIRGRVRFAFLLAAVISLSLLTACELPDWSALFKDQDQREITTSADEIVLEWDAPPETAVAQYQVYVRNHGAANWQVMETIDAIPLPEYTVIYSTLGNGKYDFAVAAVSAEGISSAYHSSLDPTAMPETGWYLVWYK